MDIFLGWWVFLSCWLPFWLFLLSILRVYFWTAFDVFFLCLIHDAFYPSKQFMSILDGAAISVSFFGFLFVYFLCMIWNP